MLLEIERGVDGFVKFFETAAMAEQQLVNSHAQKIRNKIRQERTKKRMDDAERNLKAERDLKKALKDARNV